MPRANYGWGRRKNWPSGTTEDSRPLGTRRARTISVWTCWAPAVRADVGWRATDGCDGLTAANGSPIWELIPGPKACRSVCARTAAVNCGLGLMAAACFDTPRTE